MFFRFSALAGALLALATATAASAQGERRVVDENGIDLMTGDLAMSETDVSIGPADTGLSLRRSVAWDAERVAHNWQVMISEVSNSGGTALTVSAGGLTKTFHLDGLNTWVDLDATGETLTVNVNDPDPGEQAIFIDRNGVKFGFDYQYPNYYARSIEYPTGYKVNLHWKGQQFCTDDQYDNNGDLVEYGSCVHYSRIQSVNDNRGYQLKFSYQLNPPTVPYSVHIDNYDNWSRLTSVQALNNAVEACDPGAVACTPTQSWPTATYARSVDNGAAVLEVVQPGGRTWRYKVPPYEVAGTNRTIERFHVKRPDSSAYTHEFRRIRGTKQAGDHDLTVASSGKEDHYDFTTAPPRRRASAAASPRGRRRPAL